MRRVAVLAQFLLLGIGLQSSLLAQTELAQVDSENFISDETAADPAPQQPLTAVSPPAVSHGWFGNFVRNERAIWLSPAQLRWKDARWLVPFAAATGALIASDADISAALPNTASQVRVGERLSRLGAPYTVFGVAGGAYLVGRFSKNERLRDTGKLGIEAALHALIVTHAIKLATGRERPEDADGQGDFFQRRVSFPSGHSMMSWSLASVIAHQYHDRKAVVFGAYATALAVNAGRTMARKHFVSDSLVGGVFGYLIGTYLYNRHQDQFGQTRAWVPDIAPLFDRSTRNFGVALTWQLTR